MTKNDHDKILALGRIQLKRLRSDIVLNSLFLSDYKNRYGIDERAVYDFFGGYVSYLEEIMREDPLYDDSEFNYYLPKYDTIDNLVAWQHCHG